MKKLLFILLFLMIGCDSSYRGDNKVLVELHNEERAKEDLDSLVLSADLCDYAQKHADWMALKSRLSHSNMSDLAKAAKTGLVGENIAWGQEDEKEVLDSWMHSTGHRRNILNSKYKKMGCGMKKDKKDRPYWCVVFSGE